MEVPSPASPDLAREADGCPGEHRHQARVDAPLVNGLSDWTVGHGDPMTATVRRFDLTTGQQFSYVDEPQANRAWRSGVLRTLDRF
jgi:hypothetical protein